MKGLKSLMLFLAIPVCLTGCATMNLPDDATPAEQRAALCADGQIGLAMADAALAKVGLSADEIQYWTAFRAGAQIAVDGYCGGVK